jgi:putative flippase GtrA
VKFEFDPSPKAKERRLVMRYAGVSLVGFATDAAILHTLVELGMEPAWARLISLGCAMHVTFVLNGLHVFRQLDRRRLPRQWVSYMATNAFGNFCNYWIFVTLVSTHWRVISNHLFALGVGSLTAWVMNFAATRFIVFRRAKRGIGPLEPAGEPPRR